MSDRHERSPNHTVGASAGDVPVTDPSCAQDTSGIPHWRDTFERFHNICKQEEARQAMSASRPMTPDELERHGYPRDLHTRPGALPEWRDGQVPASNGPAGRIGAKLDADLERNRIMHPTITTVHGVPQMETRNVPIGVPQPAGVPYTPSTEQVRAAYVRAMRNAFIASAGEHTEEFDRWLRAEHGRAWAEGWDANEAGGPFDFPYA